MAEWSARIGFVALTLGCAAAWPPAGAIVGGAILLAFGVWGTVRQLAQRNGEDEQ